MGLEMVGAERVRLELEARGEDGGVVGAAGDGDESVGRLVEAGTVEGADGTSSNCARTRASALRGERARVRRTDQDVDWRRAGRHG